MFNNPFLKKDPLLEAVKAAQADGEMRRQAEAIVNEEFGVYSRKAVVREDLAAYDVALEETYKALKEGWEGSKEDKDEDKKLAKKHGMTMKQWEKSDADKKHDAKEKLHEKMAKKDWDKDGEIESEKAEVLGSRIAAAKRAGKMEEKKMWEGSEDTGTNQPTQASKDIAAKTASQTPDKPYADRGPSGAEKADLTNKIKAMNETQLDELRQKTISSYIGKAHARMKAAKESGFKKGGFDEKKGPKASKARAEFAKRGRGLGMAGRKLAEEEQINELTGKGKLPQMKANYQDAKKIHSNEADWHAARADRAERRGESKKAEHHMDAGYGHEEKAERAGSKLKRANALMTRAKAVSDIKSSKAASKSARSEYREEAMYEAKKWIQAAIKKKGALSKQLGVPEKENIPAGKLAAAAEKGGKLGKRARLAQTLRKLHKEETDSFKAAQATGKSVNEDIAAMARGRTRVSSYGRSQTEKGVGASRSFGTGFSKLVGGVADVVSGAAQAGSQFASAAERSFNRPTVTPVRSSAPGTLSAPAGSATATAPTATAPTASAPAAKVTAPTPTNVQKPAAPAAAAPKVTSPKTSMKTGKTVVSKSDLETYRQNVGNKNATLGQYMNDLSGKTAIAGGRNDPAQIQKRLGAGQKAFDPTTSSGQYEGPKTKVPTPPSRPANLTPSSTTSPEDKPVVRQPEPKAQTPGPSTSLPSMAQTGGGASDNAADGAAKMNAMPKAPTPDIKGSVTTKDSALRPKTSSSVVAESYVSVGENKYRIV